METIGSKTFARAVRYEAFPVLLILAVVILSFSPLLFFGRMFFDEEQIGFYYAQSFFHQNSLRGGASLLWNGAYYGGVPVGFDQFVSAFYPLNNVLFRLFPFFSAHHISIVIAVSAGCLLAYWFGRANGFSRTPALVLAFSYLLATPLSWLAIGTLAAHSFIVLPGLFLALLKISRREHPIFFLIFGGVVLGVGFLAGFVQIVFYALVLAFLWALWLDMRQKTEGGVARWFRARFRHPFVKGDGSVQQGFGGQARLRLGGQAILGLAGIAAIALLIGGRQILPSVFLIDYTIRTATYAIQHAETPNVLQFLTFIFPDYLKLPFFGTGSAGFYVGPLAFVIIVLGIIFLRTSAFLFFLGMYGIVVGFSFHFPVLSWFNDYVPPFSRMGGNFRWMVAGAFPLAYLAAEAYHGFMRGAADPEKYRFVFKVIGWSIALFFILYAAAYAVLVSFSGRIDIQQRFIEWYFSGSTPSFGIEHYVNVLGRAIDEIRMTFSPLNWRFSAPILLVPFGYVFLRLFAEKKISLRTFHYGTILFVSLNVVVVFASQFNSFARASLLEQEPMIVQEIKKREKDLSAFRITGFLVGDSMFRYGLTKPPLTPDELAEIERELMVNNVSIFYGLQRIDGLEPYRTIRHNQLLDTVVFPGGLSVFDPDAPALKTSALRRLYNTDVLKTVTPEEKTDDFLMHLPALSMLNVKYIYSLIPLRDPRLRAIDLPPNPFVSVPAYLYENTEVLPRVYFAENVAFHTGRDIDLLAQIAETRDFKKNTFIECSICPPPGRGSNSFGVRKYENGFLELNAETEAGGWLVFGESAMPGWIATIDGDPAPILTANYLWQSVYVPPGKHKVEFVYNDITLVKWKEFLDIIKN